MEIVKSFSVFLDPPKNFSARIQEARKLGTGDY